MAGQQGPGAEQGFRQLLVGRARTLLDMDGQRGVARRDAPHPVRAAGGLVVGILVDRLDQRALTDGREVVVHDLIALSHSDVAGFVLTRLTVGGEGELEAHMWMRPKYGPQRRRGMQHYLVSGTGRTAVEGDFAPDNLAKRDTPEGKSQAEIADLYLAPLECGTWEHDALSTTGRLEEARAGTAAVPWLANYFDPLVLIAIREV